MEIIQCQSGMTGRLLYKVALTNAATTIITNMTQVSMMVVQGNGGVTVTREMQQLHDAAVRYLTKEFNDE
jgi:hypothetical protein